MSWRKDLQDAVKNMKDWSQWGVKETREIEKCAVETVEKGDPSRFWVQ
jgi:hypothetical protein